MVSENTVLIVGAGGSMPYGYPSGSDLVIEIIDGLSVAGAPLFIELKRLGLSFTDNDLFKFRESLYLSRRYSIDLYLEMHPEFMEIGKAAIAASIIPREVKKLQASSAQLDWYRYFFDRIVRNHRLKLKGRLTILTFNYDRSLDQYLYDAFFHADNLTATQAAAVFGDLEIIHLHGTLGTLQWQTHGPNDVPRHYGENVPGTSARQSAQGIKIIHEQDPSDQLFRRARNALDGAKRVVFLGFGYEPTNVHRLFGENPGLLASRASLHGITYGLTRSEADGVVNMFARRMAIGSTVEDCHSFLRNHIGLLS